MKKLKKIATNDTIIRQLQNNVEQVTSPIVDKAILDGVHLKEVELTALKANLVPHKLGRKVIGWIITRKRADVRIWDLQDNNDNKNTLALTCSHDTVVDIWIF